MASTTLTTFLLDDYPSARSVKLLGSWDNFSKPYTMQRDKRVSPGHWKGCHIFSNIICDGSSCNPAGGRTGGLKMGSTYWYYVRFSGPIKYLLDDDIEFCNESEPVTTLCPFLPGQPVNILHVPIVLPDNRVHGRRDDSNISSQESESLDYRTMEPEDKYLNPRQPPKPKLCVKTSPPLGQQFNSLRPFNCDVSSWDEVIHRSTSQPFCPTDRPKYYDGRREAATCKDARSISAPRVSNGVREASRRLHGQLPRDGTVTRNHSDETRETFGDSLQQSHKSAGSTKYSQNSNKTLRRQPVCGAYDNPVPAPAQNRKASNSKPKKHSPLKSFLNLITPPKTGSLGHEYARGKDPASRTSLSKSLATEKQPAPSREHRTPKPPSSKNKRLPSLPNSPSSVTGDMGRAVDAQYSPFNAEEMLSQFSGFTSTDNWIADNLCCEDSRISEWGTDTETICSDSMISSSTYNYNENQISPISDRTFEQATSVLANNDNDKPHSPKSAFSSDPGSSKNLSVPRLSLTLCSLSLDIPGISTGELELDDIEGNNKRHGTPLISTESFPASGLPRSSDTSSTVILREDVRQQHGLVPLSNVNGTEQT